MRVIHSSNEIDYLLALPRNALCSCSRQGGDTAGHEAYYLLAVPRNALDSCNRHCGAAARLNSERPGSVTPLSKNIYSLETSYTRIASVSLEVLGTDRKHVVERAHCLSFSILRLQLANHLYSSAQINRYRVGLKIIQGPNG